ncbi:MAG: EF-hand domain-containing protein, partial [Sulfurimonas sp.]|nr:EF-hand domain-containing protein [Sulfurimonas sp.]
YDFNRVRRSLTTPDKEFTMTINSNTSAYSSYSSSGVSSSSKHEKPNFEDMAQQLISALDTDSNGSIDKAEFTAAAQTLASSSGSSASESSTKAADAFSKLDTNSDGSMSSEELIAALKDMKPPEPPQGKAGGMPPPPPPSDSSSSSESSSTSSLSEIFSTLDTNKDGAISQDELMALFEDSKDKSSSSTSTSSDATSTSASSTSAASTSASEVDTIAKRLSQNLLKQILSSYGSNGSTGNDTKSLLSLSA